MLLLLFVATASRGCASLQQKCLLLPGCLSDAFARPKKLCHNIFGNYGGSERALIATFAAGESSAFALHQLMLRPRGRSLSTGAVSEACRVSEALQTRVSDRALLVLHRKAKALKIRRGQAPSGHPPVLHALG